MWFLVRASSQGDTYLVLSLIEPGICYCEVPGSEWSL